LATMHYVLLNLCKVCAPFMPFVSEEIYQKLKGNKESVHLEDWPEVAVELINTRLLEQMESARKIIEQALAVRAKAGIKIRQPLSRLYITKKSLPEELFFLIKDEVNIKDIELADKFPLGKNFETGANENYKVCLDLEISENLKLEGHARELVRQINFLRKERGLSINDLIELSYKTKSKALKKTLEKFGEEIKANTLTKKLVDDQGREELEINGEKILITIRK